MAEIPGEESLHARGAKDQGDPLPPPIAASHASSDLPPGAHGAIDKGEPMPPLVDSPDEPDHAIGAIDKDPPVPPAQAAATSAAVAAFLAGAHLLEAYLTDCLNAAAIGLGALGIAAAVILILWLVDTVYARGAVDKGDPVPPPYATTPANVASTLVGLAGLLGITLGVLEECLSGLHIILGVADVVLAGWILIWINQAVKADAEHIESSSGTAS